MENPKSNVSSDNLNMSTKLKSSNLGADGHNNTMDSTFQDGGQNNQERNRGNFQGNFEGNHMNSEMNNFSQGPGNQNMSNDSFAKMNENASGPQASNFNGGFNRGNFGGGMTDQQHGGMNATGGGGGDFAQHDQFSQFGQQNIRPGFPGNSRNSSMPGRPGMGPGNNMAGMPGNFGAGQQRMMSGPSIQQQGGPTPTLNQLLTNSGPNQRYQGAGYGDNNMGQYKGGHDMSNNTPYNSQNWGGQSRQGNNPYQQQQMQPNQPFRNQVMFIIYCFFYFPFSCPNFLSNALDFD